MALIFENKIGGGGWGEDNYVPGKIEALQVVGNNWCKEWFHLCRKDGSVQSHVAWRQPLRQVVPQHYLIFAIVANFLSRWNDICKKKKYIYIYLYNSFSSGAESHIYVAFLCTFAWWKWIKKAGQIAQCIVDGEKYNYTFKSGCKQWCLKKWI